MCRTIDALRKGKKKANGAGVLGPERDAAKCRRHLPRRSDALVLFYETPSAARQLDSASALKPAKDSPAECGPGSADAPARQHIGRIVDTQINAANANSYR